MDIVSLIENGLEICERPYEKIASKVGADSRDIINGINDLKSKGIIRRFGVVVQHHELGYRRNAMVVWNIPDEEVEKYGLLLKSFDFVTLCYQRRRIHNVWPYNLYCMIHAKSQEEVAEKLEIIKQKTDISKYENKVLISQRCFKQKGARYSSPPIDWKKNLINRLQRGIGVEPFPFKTIASEIGIHESEVIAQIKVWLRDGTLTRFGPMYNVEKMGGEFTLVAMEVPIERFDEVNDIVNSHPEVAHNYEREHKLNMWFVVACDDLISTKKVLTKIEAETGLKCYPMPKEKEYYLNLQLEVK